MELGADVEVEALAAGEWRRWMGQASGRMGTTGTGSGERRRRRRHWPLASGNGRWMCWRWSLERRRRRRRWPPEERRRRRMAHGRQEALRRAVDGVVAVLWRWRRACAAPGRGLAYAAHVCVGTVAQWWHRRV
uniref:Uncharacterized protein n=1 Tax=Oryza glumipatula TaxID=40148 RepID=A0A0D9ZIZ4_9ORYZ